VAWDDPREQVLRWSLGLDERAPKRARVAVLFGTGRRCGPDLLAAEATRSKLMDLFRLLGRNCTCTTDPTWLLGPALPVDWSADLQAQVREALGFDPTSPAVAEALSGVWTKLRRPANGEAVPDSTTGYVEFSDERTSQPPPKEAGDDPDRRENSEGSFEQRGLRAAAVVGGGLLALAAGGTAILILRQSRRA
jgi:hypothetical protein